MQSIGPDMTKSLGKAPRTRTCYICGRGYGLSSFEIHLKVGEIIIVIVVVLNNIRYLPFVDMISNVRNCG